MAKSKDITFLFVSCAVDLFFKRDEVNGGGAWGDVWREFIRRNGGHFAQIPGFAEILHYLKAILTIKEERRYKEEERTDEQEYLWKEGTHEDCYDWSDVFNIGEMFDRLENPDMYPEEIEEELWDANVEIPLPKLPWGMEL